MRDKYEKQRNLSQCTCHYGLDHGSALLVQEMDFIDNQKFEQLTGGKL